MNRLPVCMLTVSYFSLTRSCSHRYLLIQQPITATHPAGAKGRREAVWGLALQGGRSPFSFAVSAHTHPPSDAPALWAHVCPIKGNQVGFPPTSKYEMYMQVGI